MKDTEPQLNLVRLFLYSVSSFYITMGKKSFGGKNTPQQRAWNLVLPKALRNLRSSKCSHSGTSSLPAEQLQSRKKKKIQEKGVLIFRKLETQNSTSKH